VFDHISKHLKVRQKKEKKRTPLRVVISTTYIFSVFGNVVKHGLFLFDIILHDVTGQAHKKRKEHLWTTDFSIFFYTLFFFTRIPAAAGHVLTMELVK